VVVEVQVRVEEVLAAEEEDLVAEVVVDVVVDQ
jgi:hypothetical protein